MDKIKPLPAKKVIKALERIGFQQIRQKGSHLFMRHPDGRTTIITVHPGEDVGKGMIRKIINDAKITREEDIIHGHLELDERVWKYNSMGIHVSPEE